MKKLIVLAISLLAILPKSFSQTGNITSDVRKNSSYWDISYTIGSALIIYNDLKKVYKYNPGYSLGLDLQYNFDEKSEGIIFGASYTRVDRKRVEHEYVDFIGITVGPHFTIAEKYFAEAGFGNYFVNHTGHKYLEFIDQSTESLEYDTYIGFGLNAGAGVKIDIGSNLNLLLKGKINLLFPDLKNIVYAGLYTGITFDNKTSDVKLEKQLSKNPSWGIALTGGVTSPDFFTNNRFKTSGNIGIDAALRTSLKFEAYGSLNHNLINRKNLQSGDLIQRSYSDFTFGPRWFIGKDKYLAFVELGGGVYVHYSGGTDPYTDDDLYPGISFGTGMLLNVYKSLGIIVKDKIHFIFNGENSYPGGYLTVAGGVRYEL
jgi:hypothetical protein